MLSVRRLPPGPLIELPEAVTVLRTGALGFLYAVEEDRRRLVLGFRSLLDGLDAPLQVLIHFTPGHRLAVGTEGEGLPRTNPERRAADLPFAGQLRHTGPGPRRGAYCITSGSAAGVGGT